MAHPAFPAADRRKALAIFASVNGRADLVEKMLEAEGLKMAVGTVRNWAYVRHRDEYADVRQEYEATVRRQAADRFRSIADLATDVSTEAMLQIAEALRRGEVQLRDLPKVAREAMVAAGIATDKGELLSDRPTQRVASDFGDLQRELDSVGITIVLTGSPGDQDLKLPAIDVTPERPELHPGRDGHDESDPE